ncbi:TfoX/Sxy family protein [Marinoscillum furvescens]|uniref:DNA transformation protein n=1 Tax=Marinoscillum furvescens DSM 4134 TaxID=1122208 RepID=A0A3D9L2Z6_MARFU|nr:TfoX/Sxy family protein [Marinoscillum furvescens]RED99403.1 DNA transformation protein [Marinoscillum furvescens DSM 4134]
MAVDQAYLDYISEQLSGIQDVTTKRMFGGIGFFHAGQMFGMIGGETFRLKVGEHNQADYEAHGMKPYHSEKKKKGMPYWEVPKVVIDDKEKLTEWAHKAIEAAQRS